MEARASCNDAPSVDDAKKLADWAVTKGANELYAKNYAIVAMPGIASKLEHIEATSRRC